jgi:alkyl hydroperoxide reductase subunit D
LSLDALIDTLPGYAKDLKLNFSTLVRQQTELTPRQLWGTVVASAIASGDHRLIASTFQEATTYLSVQEFEAAKAAAAIMSANNIYYRFLHLTKNEKYRTMPARLRMNVMRSHGVDQNDFELWCTAVSAINGCGACVDAHEQALRKQGISEETILAVVRVASVVHAISSVLNAESAAVEALA